MDAPKDQKHYRMPRLPPTKTITKAKRDTAAHRAMKLPTHSIRLKPSPKSIIAYQQTHSGGEIKSMDTLGPAASTSVSYYAINNAGVVIPLNIVCIGSSSWQRIGRKITMKSLQIKGTFGYLNIETASPLNPLTTYCRLMIVYDKQTNGATANVNDILLDQVTGADDTNNYGCYAGINMNNRDRFEVIVDHRITIPYVGPSIVNANAVTANATPYNVEIFRKLHDRETHFKKDTTPNPVIGDISTGSLLMLLIGDQSPTYSCTQFTGSIRLRYSDL